MNNPKARLAFIDALKNLQRDFELGKREFPAVGNSIPWISDEELDAALGAAFREMYGDRRPIGVTSIDINTPVVVCNDGTCFQYVQLATEEYFWQEMEAIPGTVEAGGRK